MEYFSCGADFEGQQDVIAGTAPDSLLKLISGDVDDEVDVDVDQDFPLFPDFGDLTVTRDLNLGSPDAIADRLLGQVDDDDDGAEPPAVDEEQEEEEEEESESSPASPSSVLYEEIPFFDEAAGDVIKQEPFGGVIGGAADAPAAFNEVVLNWDGKREHEEDEDEVQKKKIRRCSGGVFSSSSSSSSDDDEQSRHSPIDFSDLPNGRFCLPLSFGAKPKDVKDWDQTGGGSELKKPRMSYAQLIAEALMNSPDRRLTLNDIYCHINARHPFYSLKGGKNWQNAIRHNLTLNKSFVKVPRPANEGRGSYWELETGAEKSIFKRLLRQHYMYKVAVENKKQESTVCSSSRVATQNQIKRTFSRTPQIKIIKSVPSSSSSVTSSVKKPTIIYVTLPKSLFK